MCTNCGQLNWTFHPKPAMLYVMETTLPTFQVPTRKQKIWLNQHGGRTMNDLVLEHGELGIMMSTGRNKEAFYYMPDDQYLRLIESDEHGNSKYKRYTVDFIN